MIRIIFRNKSNLFIIFCTIISSVLMISIGILFSSFRNYLIDNVESEIGDYHVIIKGKKVSGRYILSNKYKDGRNYIRYKEISRVYKNTSDLCGRYKCLSITYNDSLLSLYGMSRNKNILNVFKSFLYFFVSFFGIIIFFIIYNSFNISIGIRRKEIALYKLVSADDDYLYKLYFKELFIMGSIGILFGFLISVFLNFFLIKIINILLYELFLGKLKLCIYFSFIVIPIIFLILIIFLCSLIPLKKIKKYKALELFRENNKVGDDIVRLNNNVIFYLFRVNINRFRERYKSLIICTFIFCFSFNVITLILRYGLKCIDDFVIVPKYDLSVSVKGDYNFEKINRDLKTGKKTEFHSCLINVNIPKEYFKGDYLKNNDVIITDLGKNEVINNYEEIKNDGKISHIKYRRFKQFDKLVIDDNEISDLKLTDRKYFGIDGNNTVINLDKNNFKKVCVQYDSNLIAESTYNGIDRYLNNLIRKEKINMTYLNVRKSKEIISNLILVLKLFFYGVSVLIFICLISVSINVSIFSIFDRRREIFSFIGLGLCTKELFLQLFLECFYVSLKGFIISIPFIFIVNKYLYMSIKKVFDFGLIIIGYTDLFVSFILSFGTFFLFMLICFSYVNQKSLISNIKYNY